MKSLRFFYPAAIVFFATTALAQADVEISCQFSNAQISAFSAVAPSLEPQSVKLKLYPGRSNSENRNFDFSYRRDRDTKAEFFNFVNPKVQALDYTSFVASFGTNRSNGTGYAFQDGLITQLDCTRK